MLHLLCENNFSDGLQLALDYLYTNEPAKAPSYLSAKDYNGNNPIFTCVMYGSHETLEVMLRYDGIDLKIKNPAGKTALELA